MVEKANLSPTKFVCIGVFLGLFFAWVSNGMAGQDATPTPAPVAGAQAEYVIGLGDQLQIMVWKEQELTQSMSVRIDGRISLPLVGDVHVAGKTIHEIKKVLEEKYAAVVAEPAVSVMLVQSKSLRYYVIGQIRQPGEFPIDFPITVLQAIAKSGGFQEWAKTDRISIIRNEGGREAIIPFDYQALVNGQNLRQNVLVAPGDTIIIP